MKSFFKLVRVVAVVAVVGAIAYKVYEHLAVDSAYKEFDDDDFDLDYDEEIEFDSVEKKSVFTTLYDSARDVVDSIGSFIADKVKGFSL